MACRRGRARQTHDSPACWLRLLLARRERQGQRQSEHEGKTRGEYHARVLE